MTYRRFAAAEPPSMPPLHFVEEISHRVVNEYAEAIASLSLAAQASSNGEAQAAIAQASEMLRSHAAAHRALLPPGSGAIVDLERYLREVCLSLSNSSFAKRGVQIILRAENTWLSADVAWRIGLIVAELIRNAARHGFAGGAGAIAVLLSCRSGLLRCSVVDNGRSRPQPAPGRGRRLLVTMAEELGGSIDWWFSPFGSLATLSVPLEEQAGSACTWSTAPVRVA
jgi:two-component sensor histidine kinase